jgi:hypothetical protein
MEKHLAWSFSTENPPHADGEKSDEAGKVIPRRGDFRTP